MSNYEIEYKKYLLNYLKLDIQIAIDTELLSFEEFVKLQEERQDDETE